MPRGEWRRRRAGRHAPVAVVCLLAGATVAAAAATDGGAVVIEPAVRLVEPDARATFAFTGDLHALRAVNAGAQQLDGSFDYSPMFANVAGWIGHADVGVCHMEQPIAPPGTPVFVEPPMLSAAAALAPALTGAGYDLCSTASNHSLDRGVAGVDATLAALDSVGIAHAGTARTPDEAVVHPFEVNGISVGFMSYTFGFHGGRDQPWRANLTNASTIISEAQRLRTEGADAVIVSLEWGIDKQSEPSADQRSLATTLTASGAIDLIVGHQAHVLQPIELVNDTWVVFGLGNHLSNHPTNSEWPANSQDGAIVYVEFTRTAGGNIQVGRPTAVPTWVDKYNGWVIRTVEERFDPTLPASTRSALATSLERTRSIMGPYLPPGW